jgi:hypothetical protein
MIHIVNVSEVTAALERMLVEDQTLGQAGTRIERSGDPDNSDDTKGFIGIYRERVSFPPRTLGAGSGYRRQNISLVVLLKESNHTDASECEVALELLVTNVMRVVLSDESIRGTVDMLDENIDIRYDSYDKIDGLYTQNALLSITAVVNVRRI